MKEVFKKVSVRNGSIEIDGLDCFDLARSCTCGQSFRWAPRDGGWFGVAGGRGVLAVQEGEKLTISPGGHEDIGFWLNYMDLGRDYRATEERVAKDPVLSKCMGYASGIHIFNQEPFEALISFIISANNNIKRIMGIVERLCALAGEERDGYFCFPAPEAIARLSVEQLTAIGSGYRAPYIQKSAAMIAEGYDLESLRHMPLAQARKELIKFPGVGPKVADCILLFSLGHTGAFPLDVWMKRAMRLLYFDGKEPDKRELNAVIEGLGSESGILQQYIFHYARENM